MSTDAVWRRRRCTVSSLLRDLWAEGNSWRAALDVLEDSSVSTRWVFSRRPPFPLRAATCGGGERALSLGPSDCGSVHTVNNLPHGQGSILIPCVGLAR